MFSIQQLTQKLAQIKENSFQFSNFMEKATEAYLAILMLLLPMLSFRIPFFIITIKSTIFFMATLILAVLFIIQLQKEAIQPRPRIKSMDGMILAAFLYNLLFMISKIMRNNVFYEPQIIVMALCFTYMLLSRAGAFHKRYLYYICASSFLVFAAILYCYLMNPQAVFLVEMIINDHVVAVSYALMVAALSVILYCTEERKWGRIFSASAAVISFSVLFLSNNIVGICIAGILFLVIPITFKATANLIKRNMQMAFLYFFMLSNMALITNYTKLVKVHTSYSLTTSIYLDLLIATVGIFFFSHWEKIPKGFQLSEILMVKVKKVCRFLLYAVIILFLMLITLGQQVEAIPNFIGRQAFFEFVKRLQSCYLGMEGTLYSALKEYGILGGIFIIALFAVIVVWLKRNYDRNNETSGILTAISIVYLIQSLFMKQQIVTTPCYIVFVILAVCHRKDRNKKVEEENEKNMENSNYNNGIG